MTLSNLSEPSILLLSMHMGWGLSDQLKLLLYKDSESTCLNKASLLGIKFIGLSSNITHPLHKRNTISSHSNSMHRIEH